MKQKVFEMKLTMGPSLNGSPNIILNINIRSGESSDSVFKTVKEFAIKIFTKSNHSPQKHPQALTLQLPYLYPSLTEVNTGPGGDEPNFSSSS